MPIAGLVDLIAHANSNKLIEPVKRNNARLRITTGNLLKVLQAKFKDDTGYLETVGKALAGDVYPLDVSFTPPAVTNETRHLYGINNITINYGGYQLHPTSRHQRDPPPLRHQQYHDQLRRLYDFRDLCL